MSIENWIYKHSGKIVMFCLIIMVFGIIIVATITNFQGYKEEVCDVEYGYYGFKASCDYWDWKVMDKHHYNSLGECERAYYSWGNQENCIVFKQGGEK